MKTRILSFALALLMALSLVPVPTMAAVTADTVKDRIDQVLEDHPAGTYFTVNGKACSHGAYGSCDNCKLSAIVSKEQKEGKLSGWQTDTDAWTCFAFARYVFQRLFGIPTKGKENLDQYAKGEPSYDIFRYAEPGDLIYCFSDPTEAAASDNVTAFHVAVVVSCDKDGAVILQNNANGTNKSVGTITYGTISYSSMKSSYGWKYVKLRRSTSQDPPIGVKFLPADQSTWADKEKITETNAVVVAQLQKNKGVKVTEVGLDLYDAGGKLLKSYSQKVTTSDSSTSWPCYWDINEEIGVTLTPGTTYQYRFTGVFNGTKYESDLWSFKTVKPTPAAPTPAEPASPPEPVQESTPPATPPETEPEETKKPDFVSLLPDKFSAEREWSVLQFDDISTKAWYYENVKAAYRYNLMNGRGRNEFIPDGSLTVAESITLAARIHAEYYGKTIPNFDGGTWYDGYVAYAAENGIYAQGNYDDPATREVFARILSTALPVDELWDNGNRVDFVDEEQIYYKSAVELLCRAGVINGTVSGDKIYFDPDSTITRAQAAAIVTRMVISELRTQG